MFYGNILRQQIAGEYEDNSGTSYSLLKRVYENGSVFYYVDGTGFEADTQEVAERYIRETLHAVKVQYNVNIIEHELDHILNKAYSEDDLFDMCHEKSIQRTCDFAVNLDTFDDYESAKKYFDSLVPEVQFYGDRSSSRISVRVKGYELEQALCDSEGDQFDWWSGIEIKFPSIVCGSAQV